MRVEHPEGGRRDDREEFRRRQRDIALGMAQDERVRELDLDLTVASDRHDYSYMWTWLGVPIIQMPSDIVVTQEIIWESRPQVIVETGVARGGSAILHSSLLAMLGEGRVVAVDIDVRPHNRRSIEEHPLGERVTLIEGSSTDPSVLEQVRRHIALTDRVMVVLDSNHTHKHVLEELHLYAPMVSPGQYLVVADTLVEDLPPQEHRPRPWGPGDNPKTALDEFLKDNNEFVLDEERNAKLLLTSSRGGYLRRR